MKLRNAILASILILAALPAEAQVTKPPDPLVNLPLLSQSQTTVQTDLLGYKGWIESMIAPNGVLDQHDAAIKALQATNTSSTALIASLQGQVTALQAQVSNLQGQETQLSAQISTLQSQVAALQNPAPVTFIYALAFSSNSSRTPAANLNGATISGSIYVYSAVASNIMNDTPANVVSVSYWLDDPSMASAPIHTESLMPFDFQGSTGTGSGASAGTALPWNSAAVSNGSHAITQKITMSGGGTEVDTAKFTVAN